MRISWSPALVEQLNDMWQDGMTATEIGRILGCSRNAVLGKLHRMNATARTKGLKQCQTGRPRVWRPVPKRKLSKPLPPPVEDAPKPRNFTLKTLKARQCHWPVNDGGPFKYCGRKVAGLKTQYCPYHEARKWKSGTPPRDAESEARRIAAVKRAHAKRRRAS